MRSKSLAVSLPGLAFALAIAGCSHDTTSPLTLTSDYGAAIVSASMDEDGDVIADLVNPETGELLASYVRSARTGVADFQVLSGATANERLPIGSDELEAANLSLFGWWWLEVTPPTAGVADTPDGGCTGDAYCATCIGSGIRTTCCGGFCCQWLTGGDFLGCNRAPYEY